MPSKPLALSVAFAQGGHANRNVTRYIRHEQKYDWISHGNPDPVRSSSRKVMFCIYPRLNDDDGRGVDADDRPGYLNYLLRYWILIRKSDSLGLRVGDTQRNTISCLHLSRLIIACSISFKQESSDFFPPTFHLHKPGDVAGLVFSGDKRLFSTLFQFSVTVIQFWFLLHIEEEAT